MCWTTSRAEFAAEQAGQFTDTGRTVGCLLPDQILQGKTGSSIKFQLRPQNPVAGKNHPVHVPAPGTSHDSGLLQGRAMTVEGQAFIEVPLIFIQAGQMNVVSKDCDSGRPGGGG